MAHWMNFSKPSGVVGGGEMNRATSSFLRSPNSVAASLFTSSRSIIRLLLKVGRPFFQSATNSIAGTSAGSSKRIGSRFVIIEGTVSFRRDSREAFTSCFLSFHPLHGDQLRRTNPTQGSRPTLGSVSYTHLTLPTSDLV